MEEIWKDIKGFEGNYQISNFGKVRSFRRKNIINLKPFINNKGYFFVALKKDKTYDKKIHRLVAETFIPNPSNLPQVNHIDGNKLNNNVANLEWCTAKYNSRHSWKIGLTKKTQRQIEITRRKNKKKILQYSRNNEFIKQWDGIIDASKELNISKTTISMCANGKYKHAGGYIWRFLSEE